MKFSNRCGAALLALAVMAPVVTLADVLPKAGDGATLQRGMTRAVKKPNGSGVDVQYSVDDSVKIGQAATVVIQFGGISDPAGGSARFTADAGLTLAGADELRLPAGQSTTVTVRATPDSEGVAYINVFTTQNGLTSATSIPVRVGTAAPKLRSAGEVQKQSSGDAVISMPAR